MFSFVVDLFGRKPVIVLVLWSMCLCGFAQYFVKDFILRVRLCDQPCGVRPRGRVLVLEMFSTSKRTIFGVGMQVVWVIVL